MPYRHGHFYVGFVLLVIFAGFWASYFSPIASVPTAFHVHAVTASTWLLLLIAQSLAIHRRMNSLHRTMGLASLALFPMLIFGLTMIINVSADRFAANEDPGIVYLAPSFGIGMAVAIAAYLVLFYQALKTRRSVKLHAGYMLATPLILFESPFSRAMDRFFPWLNVIGSEGPRYVLDTIVVSNALVALLALSLYLRDRRSGQPWLVAIFFVTLQSILMWYAPSMPIVTELFAAYAQAPHWISLALALLAGVAVGWFGWHAAPPRNNRGRRSAAEPAQA